MDFSELTKIILTRIQKVEPENALKILGCILLSSPSEQRLVHLAFWPEEAILPIISDAKATLTMLSSKQSALTQPLPDSQHARSFSPAVSRPFPSPPSLHPQGPYWDPQFAPDQQHPINTISFPPRPYVDGCGLRNQAHLLRMEEQMDPMNLMAGPNYPGHCYYPDDSFGGSLDFRARGRSSSLPEFPIKPCHYFYKGYCKHGDGCKYFHSPDISDGESHLYNTNLDEVESEDHGFSPGSLEKLEREITELLKSKGGVPISIASLPMLYFEKYGKNLQADGYLTESQRHGKTGLNLTKLLARLKNSIRLIDKPHGQHSVILAEDAPRYIECMNQRNDSTAIASSSHQIYLTFPAESTFTSDDVSNYFKQYGPVRDVRIPCQDKRMFGFVSFLHPETVKDILTKRNPHYICGARVLVKPYKEKSRTPERPYLEKFQPAVQYPPHYLTMDPELHALPRQSSSSRLFRKQQIEHNERFIEFERRRLSEFNLALKPLTQPCYNYSMEEYRVPEGLHELSTDRFSYTLDALNSDSMNDEKAKNTVNSFDDQESQIELPDSPFALPPIERGIDALV